MPHGLVLRDFSERVAVLDAASPPALRVDWTISTGVVPSAFRCRCGACVRDRRRGSAMFRRAPTAFSAMPAITNGSSSLYGPSPL